MTTKYEFVGIEKAVRDASEEMLARFILKNLGGYDADDAEAPGDVEYLTAILKEHRRQCTRPEGGRSEKPVGYMNESGDLMTVADYENHLNTPAWKWVIDQHWTPVAPVYAGDFVDRPTPQLDRSEGK